MVCPPLNPKRETPSQKSPLLGVLPRALQDVGAPPALQELVGPEGVLQQPHPVVDTSEPASSAFLFFSRPGLAEACGENYRTALRFTVSDLGAFSFKLAGTIRNHFTQLLIPQNGFTVLRFYLIKKREADLLAPTPLLNQLRNQVGASSVFCFPVGLGCPSLGKCSDTQPLNQVKTTPVVDT